MNSQDLNVSTNNSDSKSKYKFYAVIGSLSLALLIICIVLLSVINKNKDDKNTDNFSNTTLNNTNTSNSTSDLNTQNTQLQAISPEWNFENDMWVATGEVPACPEPLLKSPADVNLVQGILYPGQFRGPYKAHGGMNFNGDNTTNAIEVSLAMDGQLIRASRYIQTGEVQYLLDFINPCGIVLRYDHLLTLTPEFQTIIETLPEPILNDSRTTDIHSNKLYKAGDVIASEIGFKSTTPKASVFDFGVYDLRQPNEASKLPEYAAAHKNGSATDFYAICWLNYMSQSDMQILKALPVVSGESGTQSDYCTNL